MKYLLKVFFYLGLASTFALGSTDIASNQLNQSIVVKNINISWYSPCSLGDCIFVKTNLIELKNASLCLQQVIFNEENNKKLASADVKLCFVNENMKVIKLPEKFSYVLKTNLPN